MSTAELNVNAWIQYERTHADAPDWEASDELDSPSPEGALRSYPQPHAVQDAAANSQENFWQDWFGFWG